MNYKVGIGYDIHRLVGGRKLILGGVKVPFVKGLSGHSDADVVLHAVCDAILGAAGLGDIGEHFPDTDRKYKNISSIILLKDIVGKIKRKKLSLGNVDINIICESPKLTRYKSSIRNQIAKALNLDKACVNVKAKTNEGLGGIGKGEYIAAQAVVLLKQ